MKALVLCVLALVGGGCSVSKEYVAADEATYSAVAPEYTKYVDGDPKLTAEQKATRKNTVATWKFRIEKNK